MVNTDCVKVFNLIQAWDELTTYQVRYSVKYHVLHNLWYEVGAGVKIEVRHKVWFD
jgi:hypothetical protein